MDPYLSIYAHPFPKPSVSKPDILYHYCVSLTSVQHIQIMYRTEGLDQNGGPPGENSALHYIGSPLRSRNNLTSKLS
jgi:hypothetical protein